MLGEIRGFRGGSHGQIKKLIHKIWKKKSEYSKNIISWTMSLSFWLSFARDGKWIDPTAGYLGNICSKITLGEVISFVVVCALFRLDLLSSWLALSFSSQDLFGILPLGSQLHPYNPVYFLIVWLLLQLRCLLFWSLFWLYVANLEADLLLVSLVVWKRLL